MHPLIEKNSAVHHNLSHPANSYYVLGGGIAINSYAKALMCNFTMRNSRIVGNHAARGGAIDINGDTEFEEVGLDSLDMFGLLSEIDSRYEVVIPDGDLDNLLTFNDVISYVTEKLGSE